MEESVGLLCDIKRVFECSEKDVRMYSPLTLAYIGDGIYDLVIRSVVVERANRPNGELHKRTIGYVKAQTQSKIIQALSDILTEEERDIYKRGRNAKPHTIAKNAAAGDYRRATGFEALMGFLYLTGQDLRMLELIKKGIELIGMEI
ncbi:MAG: ribonuclease III [Lachnospiraceae bacterium]|nr:ribonuclease III [Lachnospiraceae bacterium]